MPRRAVTSFSSMADRLIVALDVASVADAKQLVEELTGVVKFFKIGLSLQFEPGIDELIDYLVRSGRKVFLDTKLFDIPETVARAVQSAIKRNVQFITVHGDPRIMQAAVRARQTADLKILAVTVLTHLDDASLHDAGYRLTARELVELRAQQAINCGCDGIIAGAFDNPEQIRQVTNYSSLLIVTPGIRSAGEENHDQRRVATPQQAIRDGADYLVVGRSIFGRPDARRAAEQIIFDMQHATI